MGRANNTPPIRDRFYAKTQPGPGGCLIWTGAKGGGRLTYGAFTWHGRRQTTAHRAAWMLERGPIPEGHQVDHLCRVPLCVNVEHLDVVLPVENNRRSLSPSSINARKTHCPQGHPYSAENTYTDPKGKRHCRACMREADRRRRAPKHLRGAA
jgi:hypothetical protein